MKTLAWSRGDLCDCNGELCIVLAPPSSRGRLAHIESLEDGQRWRVAAMLLRNPRTGHLKRVWKRLEKAAAEVKNAQAHISLELQLRNP